MFERFMDLPLHVLVLHGAVVLIPTAGAAALAFALVVRWRWVLRWPVAVLGPVALAVAFVSVQSGKAFKAAVPELAPAVAEHEEYGEMLLWISIGFAVLALVSAWLLPGKSALASGKGAVADRSAALSVALTVLLVAVSVLMLWYAYRTGDSGSRAVWDGRLPAS